MDRHPAEMARLCREQAEQSLDSWTSATLMQMAADYEALARYGDGGDDRDAPPARDAPPFMIRD